MTMPTWSSTILQHLCQFLFTFWLLVVPTPLAIYVAGRQQGVYNVSYSVMEETDGPLLLGDLVADLRLKRYFTNDQLSNKNVTFLPTNPNYSNHFTVVRSTNHDSHILLELKLMRRLDREVICSNHLECYFSLQCIVIPLDDVEVFFIVRIFLLDLNDHSPTFQHKSHSVQFSESDVPSTRRPIPYATDLDSGRNARISYSLVPPSKYFRVDTDSNTQVYLTLINNLDRESIPKFVLNVSAEDFGEIKMHGFLTINVEVQDTNDCFPIFTQNSYSINVVENRYPYFLANLSASDGDIGENSRIRYMFALDTIPLVRQYVSLDNELGSVSLLKPLDREETEKLSFQIRAVDNGMPPKSSLASVTVNVLDLNDCWPQLQLNTMNGRIYVLENREKDTVVTSFTVTDKDLDVNGSVTCKLQKQDSYDFNLQLYNAQIKLFQVLTRYQLDREYKDRYLVEVNCTDGGGLSTVKVITIIVDDENDNFPLFSPDRHYISVTENNPLGLKLLKLNATDLDINNNGLVKYSLPRLSDQPESGWFQVDQMSGVLNVTKSLDREEKSSIVLQVIAYDSGLPYRFSSTATVYITVVDLNDVAPQMTVSSDFYVEENASPGIKLGPVSYTDPDLGDGGYVTFFGGDSDGFVVDEQGYIVTLKQFDRETRPIYSFYAFAKDHGKPSLTSSTLINVRILDMNDCSPKFIFPFSGTNLSMSVHEPAGYLVLQAVAKDADEGENAIVRYFLNPPSTIFNIDSNTGRLTTQKALSIQEHLGEHRLSIDAHDSGIPTLTASVSLVIVVDQRPSKEAQLRQSTSGGGANSAVVIILSALTGLLFVLVVSVLLVMLMRRRGSSDVPITSVASNGHTSSKYPRRRNVAKMDTSGSPPLMVATTFVDFKTEDNVYCSNPYSC